MVRQGAVIFNHNKTIEKACDSIAGTDFSGASRVVADEHLFSPPQESARHYSARDMTRVFAKGDFIGRNKGTRLAFPPVLRLQSHYLSVELPINLKNQRPDTMPSIRPNNRSASAPRRRVGGRSSWFGWALRVTLLATLASCGGGGGGGGGDGGSNYIVGGTVSGLNGSGLVLQLNGASELPVSANGSFSFPTAMASGTAYAVTVKTQPSVLSQTCTVSNGTGTLTAAVTTVAVSCAAKTPKFAYVANYGDGTISVYSINATTGALSLIATVASESPANPSSGPAFLAVDPTGRFIYMANYNDNTVSAFTINAATGALSLVATVPSESPANSTSQPFAITVDPMGKFVYMANYGDDTVSAYTINATTGALSLVATVPSESTANPSLHATSVTVDPTGKFAYVTNIGDHTVSAFTINPTTGALTMVAGSPFVTGAGPFGVTVDPTGKFAYTANANGLVGTVSAFTINAMTGALSPIATITSGTSSLGVTVDPTGRFAYETNYKDGTVSAYTIDATTGALSLIAAVPTESPLNATSMPNALAVDPSGKFVYVTNKGDGTVSTYTINATTGALSLVGTVASGTKPASVIVVGQ